MKARGRSGQAILEFVLVLPVVLVLLFAIIDLGHAWRTYQSLTHSAREGARLAAMPRATADSVRNLVLDRLSEAGLHTDSADLTLDLCTQQPCRGKPDRVTITYPVHFRLLGPALDYMCDQTGCEGSLSTIDVAASATMRNE